MQIGALQVAVPKQPSDNAVPNPRCNNRCNTDEVLRFIWRIYGIVQFPTYLLTFLNSKVAVNNDLHANFDFPPAVPTS